MILWTPVAIFYFLFKIDFGFGQLLTTQCDHIPTDNIIPVFEPRTYTFSPSDGIRAWLKCNWTFRSEAESSFVISLRIINSGPTSDFKVYSDNKDILYDHKVKSCDSDIITTPRGIIKVTFHSGFAPIKGAAIEIRIIAIQYKENKRNYIATPESQFVLSNVLPTVSNISPVKWFIKTGECTSGIQVAMLYMNMNKDYLKNECIDKLTFKTNVDTITVCEERSFGPRNGFFYFHSTVLEVVFETDSYLRNSSFVFKFRSNSRIRLKPEENMNIYTAMKEDQEGFDARFIDNYRGRGVFATWPFEEGDFLLEYTTLPFLTEEPPHSIYLFQVEYNDTLIWLNPLEEDGTYGRLMNDNIKTPNVVAITKTGYDNKPHLCFFALKTINIGDELTFDYGGATFPWRTEEETDENTTD